MADETPTGGAGGIGADRPDLEANEANPSTVRPSTPSSWLREPYSVNAADTPGATGKADPVGAGTPSSGALSVNVPPSSDSGTSNTPSMGAALQPSSASPWSANSYPPPRPDAWAASSSAPYGSYPSPPPGMIPPPPAQPPFWPPPPGPYTASGYPGSGYPSAHSAAAFSPDHSQPTVTKKRWPLVLVAGLLAFALGVTGFAIAGGRLTELAGPRVSPSTAPSNPTQNRPTTGTKSKTVTAAQSKGVVLIEAETNGGNAYGTGMVLTADGRVLTNYHVVAGTTKVAVTIADSGSTYAATVLGFDQTRDVALLQLKNASGLATVTLDQDPVRSGDEVAAVGNADGGMRLVKAPGTVTGIDQPLRVSSDSPWGNTEDLNGLVATNAGAVPGDSGGPMFDAQNEVLGMTTAGSTKDHSSYAIPIATALAVVNQVETGQDAGTVRVGPAGYLGVQVKSATYTGVDGATVAGIVPGSPAEKAGITVGSRLTRVGDTTITTETNVANVIRAVEPGQQVTIWWITSKGANKQATVTAGASPVN